MLLLKKFLNGRFMRFYFDNFYIVYLFPSQFFYTFGEKNHDFNRKNYEQKLLS